jgi:hypothetical protein
MPESWFRDIQYRPKNGLIFVIDEFINGTGYGTLKRLRKSATPPRTAATEFRQPGLSARKGD